MSSKTPKLNLKTPVENITKTVSKQINDITSTKKAKQALSSNNWLAWTLRIVLVLYASFAAPNLNSGLAHIFDNVIVRLVLSGLIIWLCYVDPSSAILLAVGFVISIQTLNKHKISQVSNNVNQLHESFYADHSLDQEDMENNGTNMENNGTNMENMAGYESFENRLDSDEEHHPMPDVMGEPDHPMIQNQTTFTTDDQLRDAQVNQTQNNNQNTQVQTFASQLGPQGFGDPSGFNFPGMGKLTDAANFSSCN